MLWESLRQKHPSIKSLATRRLQQDALENLFGCIRANCSSNCSPTNGQFIADLKTSILSNLSHVDYGNCELDSNLFEKDGETSMCLCVWIYNKKMIIKMIVRFVKQYLQ